MRLAAFNAENTILLSLKTEPRACCDIKIKGCPPDELLVWGGIMKHNVVIQTLHFLYFQL